MPEDKTIQELGLDEYKFGFHDPEEYFFKTPRKGIDPEIVAMISKHKNEPEFSAVIITHYNRILRYIEPDHIHVMLDGRIVTSGGKELALELEEKGYDWVRQEFGAGTQS